MAETDTKQLLELALEAIIDLRRHGCLVHCLTNSVAQAFTANVLLACGATPSMTISPEEAPEFTRRAGGVLFNLGTLDAGRTKAIRNSVSVCTSNAIPFVLDPVMCHISPLCLRLAEEILQNGPAIIRANQSEADSFGQLSSDKVCVALTGETDRVSNRGQAVNVHNGHFYMSKVTAVGCAQGALMAALAARKNPPFIAALTALVWFGVAGEIAASRREGPGSFAPAFIDALHSVSIDEIRAGARLS